MPTIDLSTIKTEDLSTECIETKPINYSWSDHEYGEDWDVVRPDVDEWDEAKCLAFLSDNGDTSDVVRDYFRALSDLTEDMPADDSAELLFILPDKNVDRLRRFLDKHDIDHSAEDDEFLENLRDACRTVMDADPDYGVPMMDCAYKLGGSPNLEHVADLPCCTVVQIDGDYYLALTGGGMDLSKEIAQSFILLGYLPPVHFCDLPKMADFPRTDFDRLTIAACRKSCEILVRWTQNKIEDLDRFLA